MIKLRKLLFAINGEVVVLVLLNCCDYWRKSGINKLELSRLLSDKQFEPCHIGKIYFVNDTGGISMLDIGDQLGRLLVVTLPKQSGVLE
jgi:hypothetical protein